MKDGNIEFKEDRRRKGRLLKQFSRRKAFPHILDLHKGHKFPNDGIWMPRSTFRKLSLNILRPQLKAEISKRPEFNRELRRKLSSPSGFRDAILSRGLGKKLTKQDFGSIPVTNEFIEGQYLNRFFLGEISKVQFSNAITKWCSDPEEYYELWIQYLDQPNLLDNLVDNFDAKIINSMQDYLSLIEKSKNSEKKLKKNIRNISQIYKKLEKEIPEDFPINGSPTKTHELVKHIPLEITKAFEKSLKIKNTRYISQYFESIFNGRIAKKSDITDLMHMQHIFECDLFRCDKSMADLFKNSPNLPSDRLVSKFTDLPERIEKLLSA